jgi:hypothetical protein
MEVETWPEELMDFLDFQYENQDSPRYTGIIGHPKTYIL